MTEPTPGKMIEEAGLDADMAAGVMPGLSAALEALGQEHGLTRTGHERALAQFRDNLSRLSAIAADRKAHPEIADVEITRPVFILGLPRCGTSILHALIGADPQIRTPLQWEVAAPSPPPETATFEADPRADGFDAYVRENFTGAWADVLKAHPVGARIPQECGMMLETAFQSINPTMLFRLPSYYDWHRKADTRFGYQVHKMWLQQLSWKNPRKRWVLKVQEHAHHLPELFDTYPDAVLVQPHRDPVTVMASISRLIEVIRCVAFEKIDREDLGQELLHLWHDGQAAALRWREANPQVKVLDLAFRELIADPVGSVRQVYDHADIEFSSASQEAVSRWWREHPADKHGQHRYELADYGLTRQQVEEVYADYIGAYEDYL
ncbi:sulfotransferase [Croceicoccus sp. F390]|uniref:Sulfotransferase n=1 Tax=Croceicoccus esteveae TaxID=3075597 RepID=A0ABU2ZIA2_9SPHN|nr:sulfotransferase [Croceicoccus sp. F390]MDT0576338.1 sulfotransferase [Croceicoccus sp. F390]